jgi:O-antigen ligase
MRIAAMPLPGVRIAVLVLLLAALTWSSTFAGTLPLFVGLTLAGPIALMCWSGITWPVGTLAGIYALLAPADALLLITGGTTLTRYVAFLALFGLALAILLDRSSRLIPRFAKAWFVTLSWMIASVFWATNQAMAIDKVEQIGLAVVVFELIVLVRASRIELRAIVAAVVASSSAIAAYALTVHPVEARLGPDRVVLTTAAGGRADPNDLAAGMILAFALCIAAATSNDRGRWRIAGAVLSFLLFAAILSTGSRGGLLAALLVVLWTAVRARRRIVAALLVAAVAGLSAIQGDVWQRFIGDETGAGRSDIWKVGVAAFQQHWLIGSGIGTFPDVYNSVYLSVPHHFFINWSRPAHDLIVQSFTELGIIGGTLVLTAWWFQFRELRSIARDDPDRWLRVGLEAATLGYFVAALFIDVLDLKQTWVIAILVAVVANVRAGNVPAVVKPAPERPPVPKLPPVPA